MCLYVFIATIKLDGLFCINGILFQELSVSCHVSQRSALIVKKALNSASHISTGTDLSIIKNTIEITSKDLNVTADDLDLSVLNNSALIEEAVNLENVNDTVASGDVTLTPASLSNESDEDFFAITTGEDKRKRYLHSKTERDNIKKTKFIQNHDVKPPCEKCIRKCPENFPPERRIEINSKFWKMSFEARKTFISNMCQKTEVKRRVIKNKENCRKKSSFVYFLKNSEGVLIQVCQNFFFFWYDGLQK